MNIRESRAKERRELLREWTEGVRHPDVSGFELLELMDIRSKLAQADLEGSLTLEERRALEEADGLFLRNAKEFYEQIAQVADLEEMRRKAGVSPSHWWWYLEKLSQMEKVP